MAPQFPLAAELFRLQPSAAGLKVPLTSDERRRLSSRLTENREALRLYLLGQKEFQPLRERLLALGTEEPDLEQLRWVVLMVLSSQPGHEQSVERFGTLMAEAPLHAPH